MEIRTPLIIKETLGDEVYEMCEEVRRNSPPRGPYLIIASGEFIEAFENAIREEVEKQFKTNKNEQTVLVHKKADGSARRRRHRGCI